MNNYFQPLIEQLSQRSAEATLSILGISDPMLRQFLSDKFNQPVGSETNFLADPVFEAIFGWQEANLKMDSLAGSLLERDLIEAMDSPPNDLKDYAFRKDWKPYLHQYHAWETLINKKNQSAVITSGTGSGKTECFVVPVLNDLVRQAQQQKQALVGVQALFLYPLNALINSQRDRLRAWTHDFGNQIRFCLYKGDTPESVTAFKQSENPNEILSRKLLRNEPPPILVTNATMLEYMLVRQVDAPILQKSQGQLRWIILDEAHTYMGSQAAELSLLLRRVIHAFGVEADKVRFIATSATIGDKDNQSLQTYLADLAGIDKEKVTVIGGKRVVPELGKRKNKYKTITPLEEIIAIETDKTESKARYRALEDHPISRKLRENLTRETFPKTLNQLSGLMFPNEELKTAHQQTLKWLDVCTGTVLPNKKPFLPIRGHLFHQVIIGLWCCVDSNCRCKQETLLADSWGFGYVYTQQREFCDCGAPVYELIFCNDCNTPHLQAHQTSQGKLVQVPKQMVDEFSLQVENEDSQEQEGGEIITDETQWTLIAKPHPKLTCTMQLSLNTSEINIGENTITINIVRNPTFRTPN